MDTNRAPAGRLRMFVFAALALAGGPALAAGPCTLKADANPAALTIPDFTPIAGGGYAPTVQKLNGSASKPEVKDGGLYSWTYVSGPAGYSLTDTTEPQATFVPADVGPAGATYVLRLTVTGCGSSTFLDYAVRVTDAYSVVSNSAPHAVASATPNPALEGQTVTLDGASSYDPDAGTTLTYQWTQIGGPALALANASSANASFVAPNVAATTTYQFSLTVSDGTLTDTTTVNVNVAWTNDPPVAQLSCPLEVNEGQPVALDGSGSTDSDDGIASYRWVQKSGLPTVVDVDTWTGSTATFDAPALGYHQTGEIGFTLFVTDNSGVEASQDCDIFIHDVTAPVVSTYDITADADSAAGANAVAFVPAPTAFDAVDGDLSYKLLCVPPSGSAFALGNTEVTCGTTDSAGNFGSDTFTVTVADLSPPVIAAHADVAVEATGPSGANVPYDLPATSDKVDGAGVASCTPPPGVFALGSTPVNCTATDKAGNAATPTSFTVSVVDTTPPAIAPHADVEATASSNSSAFVTYTNPTATDVVDGTVDVTCTPVSGSTFNVGSTLITCKASDSAGNEATSTFHVNVRYAFTGFFRPVDNLPIVNVVKAGQAIPVKFSLGGNQGLAIFAVGYPKAVLMNCAGSVQDTVEETVTAGGSSLQYDATSGQYIYVWKSDKSWAGSCRQLQVKFADGTTQLANFSFTR